jgi:CrcB protein
MSLAQLGLIALGGALGALSRYFVGFWVQSHVPKSTFPWGTFVINATGSFVLGLIMTLLTERILVSPNWRPLVTIGFIGAYTTFSTFEYESAQLGSSWQAMWNLLGSVVVGYACVILGIRLAGVISAAITKIGAHHP